MTSNREQKTLQPEHAVSTKISPTMLNHNSANETRRVFERMLQSIDLYATMRRCRLAWNSSNIVQKARRFVGEAIDENCARVMRSTLQGSGSEEGGGGNGCRTAFSKVIQR